MAASNNVEFEAAKFLQKLIQESRDEPAKLATKLYVILQHMKSSGKEHSMPYQVISRAMETVISQHNLDIEALKSSRLPVGGSHAGESATAANAGSSQLDGPAANSKAVITDSEASIGDPFDPSRQSVGPSSGHNYNYYQASMSQRPNFLHEPESPSAADPRSPRLQNQERRDQSNLGRTTNRKIEKRKRGESPLGMETNAEMSQTFDSASGFVQSRIAKVTKVQQSGSSIGAVASKKEDQTQSGVYVSENPAFAPKVHHERNMENYPSSSSFQMEHTVNNVPSQFIPAEGRSNVPEAMKNNVQVTGQSLLEVNMAVGSSLGENGKSISASGKLFNEQQLKQLRAQCLVFLAFRNGVPPKPLHVEIALGISHPKEGSSLGMNHPLVGGYQEATQSSNDPSTVSDPAIPSGRLSNVSGSYVSSTSIGHPTAQLMTKEVSLPSLMENGNYWSTELPLQEDYRPLLTMKGLEVDTLNQMCYVSSNVKHPASCIAMAQVDNIEKDKRAFDHELHPPITTEDGQIMSVNTSPVAEGEDGRSASLLHQPKHTMLEKWIMQVQKKRLQDEQNWLKKQKKAAQRISSSFERLKENVSSSEDLAAKTKSVIELKKLQLLVLQQRLRGDFLSEFFKPVVAEMDHLKSFKKHRSGRKIKQIEKYEHKMKEERQTRVRDRQKEFFGDMEAHKARLDDVFKIKRERLKGFNKFAKEFHKRKERIHREKIDRIQREKITLLKINDVEGYLRMVQDAKSDRVKQLLKETEKYLQKLGSKLREAKAMGNFEHDDDEIQTSASIEKNESAIENEDECDQAKHYKESNEKYYTMAHSIKEEIPEQPATLLGGKLREYQMNGLRWLVSLYNNHLNGILADEMGLGKTVQVISLICYLMEAKNDRGPFLVVVPSSVLPGWESEINFWAPAVHKIVYAGPPEERRRLFKERIVNRKFNVLLTTYEYLMNKHDRPKLSKVYWRYIIIDEGHRIKNASCKLNADLKHYQSSHRLLLTGTPLQNNLEELWALLNFLLPNIFNSSEDFSQWFNKPFQGNGDNSTDEALLSEEENLLIINRLHQVLRPFVLRRLKHKVENELPEKIERLIRCEASAYQKLLMKRVDENLGSLGNLKARSVQNSVMELRNICNHPYLSQLHAEEVDNLIPKHYLPPIVRLCGKLEMLDRLLPKLKATDHRVLFFSTMTRLLDVMEEYLSSKQYRYLRLDGHTSGGDRGALIDLFNQPNSPFFIFLLSIRAGGVGVNLQAADTVIIFDTDWNPQVDLQAQARAHRIGQKKDVLVLRFETVRTVEEQVRAAAEHKLGVANQSITAGFFDNDTSAEDRREYLESLLRESKKEEAAPVLDDDALNDILARSESEIDIFESVDKQRREEELARWAKLVSGPRKDDPKSLLALPSRLVTDDDLKAFYEAMKIHEEQRKVETPNASLKRKSGNMGSLNTEKYGRGKRAREIRSYEEQMTEEEFEKMCQVESPRSPGLNDGARIMPNFGTDVEGTEAKGTEAEGTEAKGTEAEGTEAEGTEVVTEPLDMIPPESSSSSLPLSPTNKDMQPPSRRGRGRPKRAIANIPSPVTGSHVPSGVTAESHRGAPPSNQSSSELEHSQHGGVDDPSAARFTSPPGQSISTISPQITGGSPSTPQRRGRRQATLLGGVPRQLLGESGSSLNPAQPFSGGQVAASTPTLGRGRGRGRKSQTSAQAPNGRGRRSYHVPQAITDVPVAHDESPASTAHKSWSVAVNLVGPSGQSQSTDESNTPSMPNAAVVTDDVVPPNVPASMSSSMERPNISCSREQAHASGGGGRIVHPEDDKGPPGFVSSSPCPSAPAPVTRQSRRSQGRVEAPHRRGRKSALSATPVPDVSLGDKMSQPLGEDAPSNKQPVFSTMGPAHGQSKNADVRLVASMMKNMLSDSRLLKSKGTEHNQEEQASAISHTSLDNVGDGKNDQALVSKLSPECTEPSAGASVLDNQASNHQNETLSGTEMEGRRLLIPATKTVVLGLEGKNTGGSLGVVARQYETENLDDMPAFPPGFEKFEASAGQAIIEDGIGSVDTPKDSPVTIEATDIVIEDQTPITEKDQIPSSIAQPVDVCMNRQKNTEVLDEDRYLSDEHTSIANKPAPDVASGVSETSTDLELNSYEGLPKDMTVDSSQMVTVDIVKVVNNSTQFTSGLEDFKKVTNLNEAQRETPSDVGSYSKNLDVLGEVGILTNGVPGSDVSASEESSPLDKVKESSEPPNNRVTDQNIVASSKFESSSIVSELWEREPEAKSEVSLLVINESATSANESHGKSKDIVVENCLVSNSLLGEVSEARPGSIASPGTQSVPDESSNMAADDEILPTTNAEAFSSESIPFKSHRNSQESDDIVVEGHDLSCGPESLRSESVSLERRPALDDASGSAETLTEVDQNNDESCLKDSSMREIVSIDREKRESDLHPRPPAPAVECIEDAVKINEDIPCRTCASDAAEVDSVDMSDCDKVIPEAAADLLKASVETWKELDKPFPRPLIAANDGSSLAKLEGIDSEIRDGGDHGQINEKELELDNPSERDCPASTPLRNSEVYDVSEQLCIDPPAEVEDLGDRENSGDVCEFIPEHSYESKQPSSVGRGDRLSDFPSEGKIYYGQALCQVDEIVPEESYSRNKSSLSTPERNLSPVMKLVDQAEETNVCSYPPQSAEVIPQNSSAGNLLSSFILMNGDSSDTKAGIVDIELGNLKEISQDSEVMPDNWLQDSIEPASYAFSERQGVESHEDSVTIASAEEKVDAHKTAIEIEENSLAVETSDLEIAEAHDTINNDQGDVSLADSVVSEAAMDRLNHSLLHDQVSREVLGGKAPSSDLFMFEEEQVDSDENVQNMQVVDEGRDASEFYTPPLSPGVVDKTEISGEEVELNEATGYVKHSSEDLEAALHIDIKEDPSEVMGFMPEDHLKGDPASTETESGLALVPEKPGEGSEPETSQGHSLQGDGIDVESIVDADSRLVKPEVTEKILHFPFEVSKALQNKDDAVNEGMESHETEGWVGKRSDATCVGDVVMNSPSAGNESLVLLTLDVTREGQIVDDKVKGQTGVDVAMTSNGRKEQTNLIEDEVMDCTSGGNEYSDILPSVTMKYGRGEDGSENKLTEGHETAMREEREPESAHFDDSVMDRASDENASSEIMPLVAVNECQREDDAANKQTKRDDAVIQEEREPEATHIEDVVMDGRSVENEHSEMLPLQLIKESQSDDNTVKEQTEGETVLGEERDLIAIHIDNVVMKCALEGNEFSEIWPLEVMKKGQSDADSVNEQAKEHETITSGRSESDANPVHGIVPDSASVESNSFELLPSDAIMEGQTKIDNVNEQIEVPEMVIDEGLESDAICIANVAVSTPLAINDSMEISPCGVIKAGQSECDLFNKQSKGPEPARNEGWISDSTALDNTLVDSEAPEVLPSYITEEATDEGQIEDDPVNEHTGPEPLRIERREYDVGHIDDVTIVDALEENETSEVLPLDMHVTNEGQGEDHQVDMHTGGHKSLVSMGYESDATGDDDSVIDHAKAAGNESSEIPTVLPEVDVASQVQEENTPSLTYGEPSLTNDLKDDAGDVDYTTSKNDTMEKDTVDDGVVEAASEDSFVEKETDKISQGDGKASYSPAGQTSEGN